jgi:predicted dehydrogenase
MTSGKTYRAAAIGRTGSGGYGHGLHNAFKDLDSVDFVALADEDEEGRRKAQEETGVPRAYSDYREMLRLELPEIVSVGPRWSDCRLEMVLACLEAGAHVYCEKPMTADLEEGDQIVSMAAATGKKVAVAHQGVYLDGTRRVKQALEEGRIGRLQAIYAHGKQDARGGGEDMIVLGTHLFNTMRFFAGNVAWMSAHVTGAGRDIEPGDVRDATEPVGPVAGDCINSYFAFEHGVSGFFDSRKDQPGRGRHFGMEIVGSEGRIVLKGGSGSDIMIYPYPAFEASTKEQKWQPLEGVKQQDMQGDGNKAAVADLIEAIEADREPVSSASSAVAALELILGAYEAQIRGGRVALPMQRRHPLIAWKEGFYDR